MVWLISSDNYGVVGIINKTTSMNQGIVKLVRQLVLACLRYTILFQARHVPGYQNVIADHLSRLQFEKARQIAPWLDPTPGTIPDPLRPQVLLA